MPKRKKIEVAETEEPWIPTRAPYLADNPYTALTKDEAYAQRAEKLSQRHDLDYEIAQLNRIILSYNIVYYDQDGVVRRAE